MIYQSTKTIESVQYPGVRFTIARVSLQRRLDFIKSVRNLGQKLEFFAAGAGVAEQLETAVLAAEIDQIYIKWGVVAIEGLAIDGECATPEGLLQSGPEDLCREIVEAIKHESELSEKERKN